MRLRDGYIIPEAGELSSIAKTVDFLDRAGRVVGGVSQVWCDETADRLRRVLEGDAPGIQLPKKRAKNGEPSTTGPDPGEPHVIEQPATGRIVLPAASLADAAAPTLPGRTSEASADGGELLTRGGR